MMKRNIGVLLASSLLLSACGDSDSNEVSVPTQPPEQETPATGTGAFEKVWGPDVKYQLNTTVYAYLNGNIDRQDMIDQFERKTPEHGIAVDPEKLRAAKAASYKKGDGLYIASNIFNDNQITFADVLMYLSQTRDDFHVEYQWSDEIQSYRYTVWHDKNGDGDFDDEGDVNADPNWYATYMIDFGRFKRELYYTESGEALYLRLEEVLVQPNSGLHFRSYSPMMTKRRESVQHYQAELKDRSTPSYYSQDTHVIVVPTVALTPIETIGTAGGKQLLFHNVEARSHNLRPDVFKKDQAITMADVLLSMKEQGLIESVGFTFWGKLASDVDVQHFVINEINGARSSGFHNYVINTGVSWAMEDFAAKYMVSQQTNLDSTAIGASSSTMPTYCDRKGQSNPFDPSDTSLDHADGIIDAVGDPLRLEECDPDTTDISDWYNDQEFHFFSDTWVMNHPGDLMTVINFTMYDFYPEEESKRLVGDEKWPVADIEDAIAPLDQQHFGWGVADCGTCHSLDGIHADGDVGVSLGVNPKPISIYDEGVRSYPVDDASQLVVAPYQCAACHGSNGAPKGHGETGTCFWCHSEDYIPPNHGTASSYISKMYQGGNTPDIPNRTFDAIDVDSTDAAAVSRLEAELQESLTPIMNLGIYPAKQDVTWQGYWGRYSDDMKVRTNSSWTTDPVYPDPYACVTCHPKG
ncbi:hypothetical protein [Ferrimonas sp. SCSIO 43195]|uniref:hypothetical protein n=1 Tax=Ferrimonas sp. SCSIO 43195 TaxID=2822844 RepID=UPI002074CE24|nr:hypothetical protein [Ferrimonas sp. SCSIO 43195]USD36804.1 hypothetical protein J8Z22_17640 [Ferrimonas sp. SCSIO 43195]